MYDRMHKGRKTHFVYYTALKAKGKSLRLLGISWKQLRGQLQLNITLDGTRATEQ